MYGAHFGVRIGMPSTGAFLKASSSAKCRFSPSGCALSWQLGSMTPRLSRSRNFRKTRTYPTTTPVVELLICMEKCQKIYVAWLVNFNQVWHCDLFNKSWIPSILAGPSNVNLAVGKMSSWEQNQLNIDVRNLAHAGLPTQSPSSSCRMAFTSDIGKPCNLLQPTQPFLSAASLWASGIFSFIPQPKKEGWISSFSRPTAKKQKSNLSKLAVLGQVAAFLPEVPPQEKNIDHSLTILPSVSEEHCFLITPWFNLFFFKAAISGVPAVGAVAELRLLVLDVRLRLESAWDGRIFWRCTLPRRLTFGWWLATLGSGEEIYTVNSFAGPSDMQLL